MRTCTVDGRVGYFHCWEQYSQPLEASPLVGGPPAGVFSRVYGVVEFTEGCERVPLGKVIFTDSEHDELKFMQARYDKRQRRKEKKNGSDAV